MQLTFQPQDTQLAKLSFSNHADQKMSITVTHSILNSKYILNARIEILAKSGMFVNDIS